MIIGREGIPGAELVHHNETDPMSAARLFGAMFAKLLTRHGKVPIHLGPGGSSPNYSALTLLDEPDDFRDLFGLR
jgi:hypothetical protein